ncbi:MAG: class I SAM-dependent methyltransferase [Clostridiales bacterium]|nr:class I SAM-dependent methyltransferase [Clostridiales bacterium]
MKMKNSEESREEKRYRLWKEAEKHFYIGWDFMDISKKTTSNSLPWEYKTLVEQNLLSSHWLLDMGTGGGEFLLELNHPYHHTEVTESYLPNIALCKQKLLPLGIQVQVPVEETGMPFFPDQTFDRVINRHEIFDAKEVYRVLTSGGMFITQQVGGSNNVNIARKVIGEYRREFEQHHLEENLENLLAAGFQILFSQEAFPVTSFYDMETLIRYMKCLPWEFPNFSVETHFQELLKLEKELAEKGKIDAQEERFVIIGKKP